MGLEDFDGTFWVWLVILEIWGLWCVGWSYLYLAGGIGGRWGVLKK